MDKEEELSANEEEISHDSSDLVDNDANPSEELNDNESNNSESKTISENPNLHLLPCRIHHSGPAEVSAYFDSIIKPDEKYSQQGYYQTSFRGKLFNGKKIERKVFKMRMEEDKGQRRLVQVGEFDCFYKWKFDEKILENENVVDIESIIEDLKVLA